MNTIRHLNLLALITAFIWVGFLVYLTSIPRTPYVPFLPSRTALPLAHYVGHLVLAAAVYLTVRPVWRESRLWPFLLAFGVSTVVSVVSEGAQVFLPDRGAEESDIIFGLLGALTGVATLITLENGGATRRMLSVGSVAVVAVLMALIGTSLALWDPGLPRVGDHWHARYAISICGVGLAHLPGTPGQVHTHGNGFIHIHPLDHRHSLDKATLGLFFETSGGKLTEDSLTLTTGQTYISGSECPDGKKGRLVVAVNGERIKNPSIYVPRDGDNIQINFQTEGDPNFIP